MPLSDRRSRRRPHARPYAAYCASPRQAVAGSLAAVIVACAGAGAATADAQGAPPDSAGYVSRLGSDTIAVERVVSSPDSLSAEVVDRYPHTERFTYVARLTPDHRVAAYTITFYRSVDRNAPVAVRLHAAFQRDSAHITIQRGDDVRRTTVAVLPGSIPMNEPSFGILQVVVSRALASRGQRVPYDAFYLPSSNYPGFALAPTHGDTVHIDTKDDRVRAVVDAKGRILSMSDPGGTLQAIVVRTPWPDLARWTADFAARDARGAALGDLSPRDRTQATIGGAELQVDYGRPTKRGRQIFGGVIPYDVVWRTGANAATMFVTDKDIVLGTTRVPAGTYTLFSLPTRSGWTLIVSRKTGEWGTEYDSTADFARIPMTVSTAIAPLERFTISVTPHSATGDLSLAWDTMVGTLPVRPAAEASP